MLAYSPDAEPGRAFLLRQYNDLDVFVEDVTSQNMYVRLLNRILDGSAIINNVFPLHDRMRVVAECRRDQSPRPRKRLYLIDGDFDAIQGAAMPTLQHLYRLNVYCAENLLLSEKAVIEIAVECETSVQWHDLALRLDLRTLFNRALQMLMPLFILYAVAEWLNVGVQTSSYSVLRLCTSQHDPRSLSAQGVRRRMAEVRSAILSFVSISVYRALRKTFFQRVGADPTKYGRFISGKTYLLPLVHSRLKQEVRFSGSMDMLKVRLSANCELDIDPGFIAAVRAAAL